MALIDNLISWWKLDEASGNALDAHGSNTLTDNNTVGTASGKVGGAPARDFEDANLEYFSRASNSSLQAGDVHLVLGAWVKLESKGANRDILSKWNTGSFEYVLYYSATPDRYELAVSHNGSTVAVVRANNFGSPSTGQFHFVVAGHDPSLNEIWICVDAGTPNTTSHSTGIHVGTTAFEMGRDARGLGYFDGVIDEAFLIKGARPTTTQLSQLWNNDNGQLYERLIAPILGPLTQITATGLTVTNTLQGMGFAAQSGTGDGGFEINTIDARSIVAWSVSTAGLLTLWLDRAVLNGEIGITLDYSGAAGIVDTEGHSLQSFTGTSVVNSSLFEGFNPAGRRRRRSFGRGPLAFAR